MPVLSMGDTSLFFQSGVALAAAPVSGARRGSDQGFVTGNSCHRKEPVLILDLVKSVFNSEGYSTDLRISYIMYRYLT